MDIECHDAGTVSFVHDPLALCHVKCVAYTSVLAQVCDVMMVARRVGRRGHRDKASGISKRPIRQGSPKERHRPGCGDMGRNIKG